MKKSIINPVKLSGPVKTVGLGLTTIAVLTACVAEPKYPGDHYFSPNTGAYATTQTVDLTIPNDATNIFVTTDSVDPWPSQYCVQNNGLLQINVDQPMAIKLSYDQYGQTITDVGYYFIEDAAIDNSFKNRDLLDTWETFFTAHVLKLFNVPDQDHSLLSHSDGQGGTVSLETNVTERGWIFDDPEEGNQTYRFDNYHYTDPQTGQSFVIESGTIYGFRGESRGFYNTELNGEPIVFSGDINGWAEGNFKMDGERTTGGYYRIFCTDAGCANKEAVYGLNTTAKEFIEIAPITNENTLSCSS